MKPNYSVFVNSCDSFEDCWFPFFTLYKKYWGENLTPIFLNTENKDFSFDGLNIYTTKVQNFNSKKLAWSDCLSAGLNQLNTPIVLYLQEDYFIDKMVDQKFISNSVDYMLKNPDIGMISLTPFGSHGPYLKYANNSDYLLIKKDAKYRISTQAALWRVEKLQSYIEPNENGWMFEIFGTMRSRNKKDIFLVANFEKHLEPIINYLHTGVIKGKWHIGIKDVFNDNSIAIDFQKRGFYLPINKMHSKFILFTKILKNPISLFKLLFKHS